MKRELYLKECFEKHFKTCSTEVFSSPGRIELLGNHTDHNNGKVLVSSVSLNILAVTKKIEEPFIIYMSDEFGEVKVNLNNLEILKEEFGKPSSIIRGVVKRFASLNYSFGGFMAYANTTVPVGAGVSSSAAFEVLISKILSYYYNDDKLEPFELAKVSQYAESVYFNKPCGLLDQSGIALGGINYIDFKDLNNPIIHNIKYNFDNYQFIIIQTGGSHAELTSYYSAIKDDMKKIANYYGHNVLREVDEKIFYQDYLKLEELFGERTVLRAKHYFEENKRVDKAYQALLNQDSETFLKCLDESGQSSYYNLKNCYCESEDEDLAKALRYVRELDPESYSRVHGGGFAGTILVVVKSENLLNDLINLNAHFKEENVFCVSPTFDGTTIVKSNSEN